MELIDLQERTNLKAKYVEMNLGDFYRKYLDQDKFPNLRKFMAFKMALFGSTYLCEQFFFKMNFMKSPYRSVMTDEYLENGLRRLFFLTKDFFRIILVPVLLFLILLQFYFYRWQYH